MSSDNSKMMYGVSPYIPRSSPGPDVTPGTPIEPFQPAFPPKPAPPPAPAPVDAPDEVTQVKIRNVIEKGKDTLELELEGEIESREINVHEMLTHIQAQNMTLDVLANELIGLNTIWERRGDVWTFKGFTKRKK